MREVITLNSKWLFDEGSKLMARFPKDGEGAGRDHLTLSYRDVGVWEEYLEEPEVVDFGYQGKVIMVRRAVNGRRIRTSLIESDTGSTLVDTD